MNLTPSAQVTEVAVMPLHSERQLITGLQDGEPACFELLVRDYGGRMLAVARRYLPEEDDAQDCVQDAYIQAFQRIHDFEGRSSIGSWLHRIVVNAALMKIRSRKRRREDSLETNPDLFDSEGHRTESESELTLSVEQLLINEESRLSIRGYIDQLPATARMLLLLRDIEGYNTEEVAEMAGMSISSVKTGLHRGRKLLKQKIEKLEGTSAPGEIPDLVVTDRTE